jgi:ferritin-like metal-binding protein YciE
MTGTLRTHLFVDPAYPTKEMDMAEIETLQELYADELKDLWSANDQMAKALKMIVKQATSDKLKHMLQSSQDGIAKHTAC